MRSIPACTGEPKSRTSGEKSTAVYPRVYGGTRSLPPVLKLVRGLSPRVRGNQEALFFHAVLRRSIPACTGEPHTRALLEHLPQVYPRVYGGTGRASNGPPPEWGLSPRVRGNLVKSHYVDGQQGSIPACTGEPIVFGMPQISQEVYPRVYGGTHDRVHTAHRLGGLSPRVRGNPNERGKHDGSTRSIPACTGEPRATGVIFGQSGVYPRVYGGTNMLPFFISAACGLSPRVRGNPSLYRESPTAAGSIPACTGEPEKLWNGGQNAEVYPRVYGGTISYTKEKKRYKGLSPRVRGNHPVTTNAEARTRSIPACTGEPALS